MSKTFALCVLLLLVFLSAPAYAQDVSIVGVVTDDSGGVLPGATITATALSDGRQYTAVASETGAYRLAGMQAGRYKLHAELQGFSTMVVPDVELLVGQTAEMRFRLQLGSLNETVTVTGEAPLIDTQSAQVAGNVDRRQMEALPILGRNWLELSMMVKGVTANSVSHRPASSDRLFQLNLDGQQISQQSCCTSNFGNPGLSRESIAEYQIVTNMFDITMGRSAGMQVQAVSRSGTNDFASSVYGYFRDDRFNSADFVAGRVLPYSNQQVGATVGGPLVMNKAHFFASYEYERQPNDVLVVPPALAPQQISVPTLTDVHNVLVRGDFQIGTKDHISARGISYKRLTSLEITGQQHPSNGRPRSRTAYIASAHWSRVMTPSLAQEVKVGYYHYQFNDRICCEDPPTTVFDAAPTYSFPGLTFGPSAADPQTFNNDILPSVRYDLTWHKGKHDIKIGGEFIRGKDHGWWPGTRRGHYTFHSAPPDLARRIPLDAWMDPSRWDLTGLDPYVLEYNQNFAPNDDWSIDIPRPTYAAWIGDTWTVTNQLTITSGVRYDLAWGDISNEGSVVENDLIIDNGKFVENVGFRNVRDIDNIAPRIGFSLKPSEAGDLVIRGGTGLFYGNTSSTQAINQQWSSRIRVSTFPNDGQPGFFEDPRRGATAEDILSGRVQLPPQAPRPIADYYEFPYTIQSMIGFQKQIGQITAFDADLVHWSGRNFDSQHDANLFYDPATGFNKHPIRAGRPNPAYGPILLRESNAKADYLGLATSFTRRYRNNFQAALTYTLMFYKNDTCNGESGFSCVPNNNFDLDADWGRSADFQRHTLRANTIYHMPWAIEVAGSFFYGSGNYYDVRSGVNPLGASGSTRVRSDLSVIPRNSFKGQPLHKLDLSFSRTFQLPRGVRIRGSAEVFNLYNHANFGSYNTVETSPTFGRPTQNLDTAYLPRMWQFAFKVSF